MVVGVDVGVGGRKLGMLRRAGRGVIVGASGGPRCDWCASYGKAGWEFLERRGELSVNSHRQ